MSWAAAIRRAAYDPETISMLSSVLERTIAALPRKQRTGDRKARLASSILGAAARGERDPIRLYAAALVLGPWEPREPLINLRIMAHCAFDSRATVWTGS